MNVKEDMLKKKKEINEKTEIFIFVFLAFILLTTWAMTQPFNSGPDEQMRYYVADYIYKHHGALPGGDDPAVRNKVWGISYAYYPVVSYMVSALFMRISTFIFLFFIFSRSPFFSTQRAFLSLFPFSCFFC